jgi:hypothetical protein
VGGPIEAVAKREKRELLSAADSCMRKWSCDFALGWDGFKAVAGRCVESGDRTIECRERQM